MADKGGTENKEGVQPIDPARDYEEEKIRMKSAKSLMTKKIKRLETALTDYEELKGLEIENKDLVGAAKEVDECKEEAKIAYKKIEEINARLEEKFVVLNRIGKVTEFDKALGELSETLEQYWDFGDFRRKYLRMNSITDSENSISSYQASSPLMTSNTDRKFTYWCIQRSKNLR